MRERKKKEMVRSWREEELKQGSGASREGMVEDIWKEQLSIMVTASKGW